MTTFPIPEILRTPLESLVVQAKIHSPKSKVCAVGCTKILYMDGGGGLDCPMKMYFIYLFISIKFEICKYLRQIQISLCVYILRFVWFVFVL